MTDPFDPDAHESASVADFRLDCRTCVAANTTACSGCVVTHLLANDAGPIELVSTGALGREAPSGRSSVDVAVSLLAGAGLLDDPPVWVARSEFESVPQAVRT